MKDKHPENAKGFPAWQGFHHIALVTPDLEKTIDFYRNVLGMKAGDIYPAKGGRGRHCFIRPGDVETWGIHFFEYPDAFIFEGLIHQVSKEVDT